MKLRSLALSAVIVLAPTSATFAATKEWDLNGNTSATVGTGSLSILSATPATYYGTATVDGDSDT